MKRLTFIFLTLLFSANAWSQACELKADTAADVLVGPFLDTTDGITSEESLTLTQAEIMLSKNGQALAQKNDNTSAVHDDAGYYNVELDATDTNTEGNLTIAVEDGAASSLPVWMNCTVLGGDFYDLKYGTTTPITSRDVGLAYSGTISGVTSQTVLVMNGGATNDDAYNEGFSVCIVGGTEEDCVDATDYVASSNTITLAEAMDFTVATSDVVRIFSGGYADTVGGYVDSVTGGINTSAGTFTTLDALDTAQDTQHAITQGYTDDIGVAGAGLTEAGGDGDHLTEAGGDGDHLTESGGTGDQLTALATAANLAVVDGIVDELKAASIIASGTCDSGSTSTCVDATLTQADDIWSQGVGIVFTSGSAAGQGGCVYDFTASSDTITFWAVTTAVTTEDYVLIAAPMCDSADDESS